MNRFVDISGFGQSGKSVISDLLREFDGYWVPHNLFEFDLVRVPGGLLDLYHALSEDWSVVRSDAAIHRFRKVVYRMGEWAKFSSVQSICNAYGTNYQKVFKGKFFSLTDDFISALTSVEFEKEWPYTALDDSSFQILLRRVKRAFGLESANKRSFVLSRTDVDFCELSAKYIGSLFELIVPSEVRCVVLHNALEPFNPSRGLRLLGDASEIVVSRDPRDIYASLFVKEGVFVPDFLRDDKLWQLKASMVGAHDINIFVQQQRALFAASSGSDSEKNKVLRLSYEEIVLRYDETLRLICEFLGESEKVHVSPRKYFDPEKSRKNIGLWRQIADWKEMAVISKELNDYLIDL